MQGWAGFVPTPLKFAKGDASAKTETDQHWSGLQEYGN